MVTIMTTLTKDNVRGIGSLLNDERFMNKDRGGQIDDTEALKIVETYLESGMTADEFLDSDLFK